MTYQETKKIISKKVVTFRKDTKIRDIAKNMAQKGISCVVIQEDKKPIGIVTERDLLKKVIVGNKSHESLLAIDVMSYPVVTVNEEVGIIAIAQLMKKKGIRRVVVTKNEKIHGIITQSDILEGMINKVKHLNWQLVHTEISLDEYIDSLKKIQIETVTSRKK